MRLKYYTGGYYCDFDPETGSIDKDSIVEIDYSIPLRERMKTSKDEGYCTDMPCAWIALYASDSGLVLQIDTRKWLLLDDATKVSYFYDFMIEKTVFSVEGSEGEFKVVYDQWWEDKGDYLVDPARASENPYNEDNDLLAFVKQLKDDAVAAKNVLKSWQRPVEKTEK